MQTKYYKDNLANHYQNLYDIDVNYYKTRHKPVPNVPTRKGRFLIRVEKDAKQKNFRRAFLTQENNKLIKTLRDMKKFGGLYCFYIIQ